MARIAILIGQEFEDSEYSKPAAAFRDAGHELVHVGTQEGTVRGKKEQEMVEIDVLAPQADADDYDALFIPGGHSPDNIRKSESVVEFAGEFMESGKPVFAICHGPQILISADAVQGRTMTAWQTIQKDLENAGAKVLDAPVVIDDNLITSRQPDDIPQFIEACLASLETSGADEESDVGAQT